jgi:hypothetical protein
MNSVKLFSFFLIILLLVNMTLFALNKISYVVFWSVIAMGAVIVYWILPKLPGHFKIFKRR